MLRSRVAEGRVVTYEKQTTEHPNPLVRLVHTGRVSRSLLLADRHVPSNGIYVDFGAGTGMLLHAFKKKRPDARLFGVEPYMPCSYPGSAEYVAGLADLPPKSVDVISAFEVCEHLYPEELVQLTQDARYVLKPGGKLILSVPIMYGALVIPKFLNRVILYRANDTGYDLSSLSRSVVGIPIPRPDDPRHTHLGFDFRQLVRFASLHLRIVQMHYHPFKRLPWFMNSQIFVVCQN